MNSTTLAISLAGITTAVLLYRKYRNRIPSNNWQEVGIVTQLFVYPLKSGCRTETRSFQVDWFGSHLISDDGYALRDRCLVIYDEKTYLHQTSRTRSKILQVKTSYDAKSGTIQISAPDVPDLQLKISKIVKENRHTGVLGHGPKKIFGIDCGDEAATWISSFLTQKPFGLRLAFNDTSRIRTSYETNQEYVKSFPIMKISSFGLYNDMSSILLANEASISDLNGKIEKPENRVTVNNFRPNIVVTGPKLPPYAEDRFDWVKIGDTVFKATGPCGRCIFTTINPESGEKNKDSEPLKTMRTYRQMNKLFDVNIKVPVMGRFLDVKKNGAVCVGDKIYVQ